MNLEKTAPKRFLSDEPLTLGKLIETVRLGEGVTMAHFAKILKVSRSHLNDIEKGNKNVSPERAARFARALGLPEDRFVELALQALLKESGLHFRVAVGTD